MGSIDFPFFFILSFFSLLSLASTQLRVVPFPTSVLCVCFVALGMTRPCFSHVGGEKRVECEDGEEREENGREEVVDEGTEVE